MLSMKLMLHKPWHQQLKQAARPYQHQSLRRFALFNSHLNTIWQTCDLLDSSYCSQKILFYKSTSSGLAWVRNRRLSLAVHVEKYRPKTGYRSMYRSRISAIARYADQIAHHDSQGWKDTKTFHGLEQFSTAPPPKLRSEQHLIFHECYIRKHAVPKCSFQMEDFKQVAGIHETLSSGKNIAIVPVFYLFIKQMYDKTKQDSPVLFVKSSFCATAFRWRVKNRGRWGNVTNITHTWWSLSAHDLNNSSFKKASHLGKSWVRAAPDGSTKIVRKLIIYSLRPVATITLRRQ